MHSLSLQDIGLRPAQLTAVRRRARDAGTTAPDYVRVLVEMHLLAEEPFDKLLRPIREDIEKSRITEEQLDETRRLRPPGTATFNSPSLDHQDPPMTRIPGTPRAVFDCNTIIQAMAFEHGPAAACIRLVESGHVQLFVSRATLAELRRVLEYEGVLSISPNMTPARIGAFFERIAYRATLIRRVPHFLDYPRDPKDEPYINLAVQTKADHLVTRDKDLLSLMTGHSTWCKEFRQTTRPLRVLDPVAFLKTMGAAHRK